MKKEILSLILVFLFCVTACSREEPTYKVDMSKREPVKIEEEKNVITYAYLPQYSHTESYQRHHLLVQYLRKETGLNIKQIFPDTFYDHMKMVGQGNIDISYSNPFVYVQIAHRFGARAFARIVEVYGRQNFRGQIICRADNRSIRSIEDCRGKKWIAVDPSSAGGYLYALGHFIDHGLKREDFSEIAFSKGSGGKQEKVVIAVYAGKYDVGSIREGTLQVVADKIDLREIHVIANTRWYPGWVYAARAGLQPSIVEKVKKALFKLDYKKSDHRRILDAANIVGVIPSKDKDFDQLRQLAIKAGLSLEEYGAPYK